MRKLVIFMHVSLDGFVAGPNGEMDWITVDSDLFDYAGARTNESDTALYGRVTWEMMESYWPNAADKPGATRHAIEHSHWYNNVAKVVASKTMRGTSSPHTRIISQPNEDVAALKRESGKDILIFGSPSLAHALMADNLIDDYWLFVNPILLGRGIPLFKNIEQRTKLERVEAKAFASGVVCLHYRIAA